MPRKTREKSESGIYHIILRGSGRQQIFHDDEDCLRFVEILEKYKKQFDVKLYGWCLMGNHIHLLLGQGIEDFSITMKRIGVSFAWYYNMRYKTSGHLFQDRFKSEKVENDAYLLTVLRYIHQNPVKAGIVKQAKDWKWSSCREYYGISSIIRALPERDLIYNMFSEDRKRSINLFREFNEDANNDNCLDDDNRKRMSDDEARIKIIKKIDGIDVTQVKTLPKIKRDEVLRKVKEIEGISQRQAARILGISPNLIFKL